MKPFHHAKISVKRHGGKVEDYMEIHDFFDGSKITYTNPQHRALLHHSFGIFLCEKIFGHTIINSDGKEVSVRTIAEEHVHDDLGWIPTPKDWFKGLQLEPWMISKKGLIKKGKKKIISFD